MESEISQDLLCLLKLITITAKLHRIALDKDLNDLPSLKLALGVTL